MTGVLKKRFMLVALYDDGSIRGLKMANLARTIIDMYEVNQKYWWVWDGAEFFVIDKDFTVTDRRILKKAAEIADYIPESEKHTIPYDTWHEMMCNDIGYYK